MWWPSPRLEVFLSSAATYIVNRISRHCQVYTLYIHTKTSRNNNFQDGGWLQLECIEKCVLFVIRHNCISHLILFTVQPLFEFSSALWTPLDHPLFWTQWYLVSNIFTNAQGLSECQMTYTKYILSDMESKYAEVSSLFKKPNNRCMPMPFLLWNLEFYTDPIFLTENVIWASDDVGSNDMDTT